MPGSNPHGRHGGVADKYRSRYLRFMDSMERIPEQGRAVLLYLVLNVRSEATGRPATVQDIGKQLGGARTNDLARGIGIGLLKATLWSLQCIYRELEQERRR